MARERGYRRMVRLISSELAFDWVSNTDTSLEFAPSIHKSLSHYPSHAGCNPLIFRELLMIVPTDGVFLDLGAGKGRAMMLAAQRGFTRVIGVESSRTYCDQARSNLERLRVSHPEVSLEVICTDARTYEIPDAVTTLFLYNPFASEVMVPVIRSIFRSLSRRGRAFHVVYMNPVHADLFVEANFDLVAKQRDGLILVTS